MASERFRSVATALLAAVAVSGAAAVTCGHEDGPTHPSGKEPRVVPGLGDIPIGTPHPDDGPPLHPSYYALDAGVCWRDLAPLNVARALHAAVALEGGGVLVVGGTGNARQLSSVESYDPERDVWSVRASMHSARGDLAATVLDDGRVLVTGGMVFSEMPPNSNPLAWTPDQVPLNTVELYDPENDTWEQRAAMHGTRWLHSALRLPDGRVLVAGGVTAPGQVAAEVYDPITDVWTPIPFPDGGTGPRFVALVGMDERRVMVVSHGASYVIDVEAARWSFLAPRNGWSSERVYAAKVGGEIWTFVGVDHERSEWFIADAGVWRPTDAGFGLGRDLATALVLEGGRRYMMTGGLLAEPGWRSYVVTSVTDIFDSDGGIFLPAGRLKAPREGHAMVELRPGVPMVIGGTGQTSGRPEVLSSVEVFDPSCRQLGEPDAQ